MNAARVTPLVALFNLLVLVLAPLAGAQQSPPTSAPPPVIPQLKEAVSHIPIPGLSKAMNDLFNALKKGEHGGYAAKTVVDIPTVGKVPLQLYFFGDGAKQALLLVVDATISLPPVFNNAAWKRLQGASLSDPIFSLSTVDFALDVREMPADFKKVIADSYYNVSSLNYTSGFQVSGKIKLGPAMKQVVEKSLNLKVADFTLRAGVVVPVPTDAGSSASLAAQLAADMKNVEKVVKDLPDFFVEFQPKPGTVLPAPLGMNQLTLTDATISLTSHSVVGFRGNIALINGKKFITYFQTPLTPAGAMDFADFQFGITAQTITLEDYAMWALSLATPKAPGGSFIKGIDKYKDQLLAFTKPLSVFEIRNPNRIGEYVFGDVKNPFPHKSLFNLLVLGPFASSTDSNGQALSGPYFQALGDFTALKQKMASVRMTVGETGLHGFVDSDLNLKMGPLGRTKIRMRASADITAQKQVVLVNGNALGRSLKVSLDPKRLYIDSPATCATPFELKQDSAIDALLDLSSMMDNLAGVNVDPAKIPNCIGKDLENAYKWVATTGSSLGGYTAGAANAELNKIANQAAEAARKAEEEAKAAYNRTKDAAREKANSASNDAMNAFRDAGNAFKRFGKKKKHRKGPDPMFAASVFDWDFYYDAQPDVVAAQADLPTHWRYSGFSEGRQGSFEFYARDYLNRYPDIQASCRGSYACALDHWLNNGINEGRQGSPGFNVKAYLNRYPDLQNAFGPTNYPEALQHWIDSGKDEGRNGGP